MLAEDSNPEGLWIFFLSATNPRRGSELQRRGVELTLFAPSLPTSHPPPISSSQDTTSHLKPLPIHLSDSPPLTPIFSPFSSSSFVLPLRLRTNDGHAWTLAPSLPSLPSFDSCPLTQFGWEWILPWTRSRNDVQLVSSQVPEIYLRSFLIQVVFFGREGKGPGSC